MDFFKSYFSKFDKIMERFSMDGSPSDSPNLFSDVGSPPTREKEDSLSLHVCIYMIQILLRLVKLLTSILTTT